MNKGILVRRTTAKPLSLFVGGIYMNGASQRVMIGKMIDPSDERFDKGYRFQDAHGNAYNAEGRMFGGDDNAIAQHLQVDITDSIDDVRVDSDGVNHLGFFGRLRNKFEANPIKTSVAASAAIGLAAVGGVNYRRYGTLSLDGGPRTGEVVAVGAALAHAFLG